MRVEIAGAQITDSVIEVLETLQTNTELVRIYIETLDRVTRERILYLTGSDDEEDSKVLATLRALQMIRRDLRTLATPPDADDPANDIPTATL